MFFRLHVDIYPLDMPYSGALAKRPEILDRPYEPLGKAEDSRPNVAEQDEFLDQDELVVPSDDVPSGLLDVHEPVDGPEPVQGDANHCERH